MQKPRALALGAAMMFAITACGSAASPAATAPAPAASAATQVPAATSAPAAEASVTIQNFAFAPAELSVKVGQSITWTNKDSTAHTVTLDDASLDSGNVAGDATFNHAFTAAGTFAYHCSIHPSMKATVVVTQ